MRLAALFAGCCLSLSPLAAAAEPLRLERPGGDAVLAELEPSALSRPVGVALVLPPACHDGVEPAAPALQLPAGLVRLQLPQTGPGCRALPLETRVLDVMAAAAWLRREAPWWNRRLYIAGFGEGAETAAMAAPMLPELAGAALAHPRTAAPRDAAEKLAGVSVPVLLVETEGRTALSSALKARPPKRFVTYQIGANPGPVDDESGATTLRLAERFLGQHETRALGPRAVAAKTVSPAAKPQPVKPQAAKPPPASAPRKTAKAGAPPRPARASTIRLAPARIAPKPAPARPLLRGALPATPDPRPEKGPAGPR